MSHYFERILPPLEDMGDTPGQALGLPVRLTATSRASLHFSSFGLRKRAVFLLRVFVYSPDHWVGLPGPLTRLGARYPCRNKLQNILSSWMDDKMNLFTFTPYWRVCRCFSGNNYDVLLKTGCFCFKNYWTNHKMTVILEKIYLYNKYLKKNTKESIFFQYIGKTVESACC